MTNTNVWYNDICFILNYAGLIINVEGDTVTDLENLTKTLLDRNGRNWMLEVSRKSKLETFEPIHDFSSYRTLFKANL